MSTSQAILRARAHGTDVVFQYWMRPYPPYSRHGSILYCDGAPTPGAVAFGVTGWMLRGRQERGLRRLGRYVDCALFEDPASGSGLAALWDTRPFDSAPESKVVLAPGAVALKARDFMGNPCALTAQDHLRIVTLHTDPVYLTAASAKALEAVLAQARVVGKGEPVYAIRATYKCDAAGAPALRLHVYNNSMDDGRGTLTFTQLPEGFVLRRKSVSFSVRANREQVLSVPLEKMPDTARRAAFAWEATDRKGTEEEGTFAISHLLVKYREGITLDGDLREWAGAPAVVAATKGQVVVGADNWGGPKDTSATLRAVWDAEGLYLAIEVTDDEFFPPPAPEWRWDSIELFYDTDLYGDWGETSCSGDDFKYSVEAATREAAGFAGPKEVTGASSVSQGARRLEIRVPLAQYGLEAKAGTAFGFDMAVDDADGEGQRRKLQILWTGVKDNYKNPSQYGVLMLVK